MANYEIVELITVIVSEIDILLDHFGLEYEKVGDRVSFTCPIHGSDNDDSLCIYLDGKSHWKCWTAACEEDIMKDGKPRGKSIFGLIRGLLGTRQEEDVSYAEAIKFALNLYGFESVELDSKYNDPNYADRVKFIKTIKEINNEKPIIESTILRDQVRASLTIPAQYFLGRGFPADLLDKYDVGFCDTPGREMSGRVVVPVYDAEHKFMLGCVGRTTELLCTKCNKFHKPNTNCPENSSERRKASKWVNSKGFYAGHILYNYWFAKKHIQESGWAILVEGQGDVWKLEMADYHVGLGIFGDALGDSQKTLLDSSGACNLLILTDNDKAGLAAREKIRIKCKRSYNCMFMDLPENDLGDMSPQNVRNFLEPVLGGVL